MGLFRRKAEKTRQTFRMGSLDKTSKARLASTFAELTAFESELRKFNKHCGQHLDETKSFNRHTKHFLNVQKPRMHTAAAEARSKGDTIPLGEASIVGESVDFGKISDAAADRDEKLWHTVLEPIRRWLEGYKAVHRSMNQLEDMRLNVDSRKRAHARFSQQVEKMEPKKSSDDKKLLRAKDNMHKESTKMSQATNEYDAKEEALYADMQRLVEDVTPVREHVLKFYSLLCKVNDSVVEAFAESSSSDVGHKAHGVSSPGQPVAAHSPPGGVGAAHHGKGGKPVQQVHVQAPAAQPANV